MEITNEDDRAQRSVNVAAAQVAAGSGSIPRGVPMLLGFVAGYVDACTFLAFNGVFVAQVTGSFVVAGSEFVTRNDGFLIKVLAIPTFFAAGILTALIVRAFGVGDRRALVATLALETCLLAGLAWVGTSAGSMPATTVAVLFGLSAMGVQSALARLLLGEYGSTNVMTTNTTQLSLDVTEVVFARLRNRDTSSGTAAAKSHAAARGRLSRLVPIILGFLTGTIVGGLAYVAAGLVCLVLVIGIVAALVIWSARRPLQPQ